MLVAPRRKTRVLHVGNVAVGGDNPIVVQSMATADTRNPAAVLKQVHDLAEAGCEIVRWRFPIARRRPHCRTSFPIRRFLDRGYPFRAHARSHSAGLGIHGLRLNPGNIRKAEDVREVVAKAKERGISIRIGVNYGSVAPFTAEFVDEMAEKGASQIELRAEWMVRSALNHIRILEELDFFDIKVSLKAFEVPVMLEAYRRFATLPNDYPLHSA